MLIDQQNEMAIVEAIVGEGIKYFADRLSRHDGVDKDEAPGFPAFSQSEPQCNFARYCPEILVEEQCFITAVAPNEGSQDTGPKATYGGRRDREVIGTIGGEGQIEFLDRPDPRR